ncbi:PREDICTED: uncharacterized protein LOC109581845 [Amphimedon queenslandica]|uniref:Uncharacterized protein n=1 Tax=Amphimedon queenslandica TaxID=400682 RepID=A0AAN0J530_AMPQE|nr:PREDICTED: uncharacterized protein LOC109581845 [Amphimedon queenslandica]|eukprot:XP_019851852.1 PREDICTED: uncharacterized protein LOC109581845 [Amphimedon queenslandica]
MCCRLLTFGAIFTFFIAAIYISCQTRSKTQSSNEETSLAGFLEDMKKNTCDFVIDINSYIGSWTVFLFSLFFAVFMVFKCGCSPVTIVATLVVGGALYFGFYIFIEIVIGRIHNIFCTD